MTVGESDQAPPAKRAKADCESDLDTAEEAMKFGLKNIPNYTLQGTAEWCPTTFGGLLEDPSTHDETFKTSNGGSISAHRVIVAAGHGSPVFHAMLYGNMKENEIDLLSIDSETLSTLLTFMYTGTVNIDSQCVEEVLEAAHYFDIASLVEQLIGFVTDSLNSTNIVDIILFAKNSKFPQLFKNCLSYIYDHADSVAHDISFTNLSSDIVLSFCKSSDLKIKEVTLFESILLWYEHQDLIPGTVLKEIFQEIRYPLISEIDLVNIVRPMKVVDTDLYTAALEYHLVPDKYRGPINQITNRRHAPQNLKYVNVN